MVRRFYTKTIVGGLQDNRNGGLKLNVVNLPVKTFAKLISFMIILVNTTGEHFYGEQKPVNVNTAWTLLMNPSFGVYLGYVFDCFCLYLLGMLLSMCIDL